MSNPILSFACTALAFCAIACGQKTYAEKATEFVAQEPETPAFSQTAAVDAGHAEVDLSHIENGVIAMKPSGKEFVRVTIAKDGKEVLYDLPASRDTVYYPLNMGDGIYRVKVLEHLEGNMYLPVWDEEIEVKIPDERDPFRYASQVVPYNTDSACVAKAREIVQGCRDDREAVMAICRYVHRTIAYDQAKADKPLMFHGWHPDRTLYLGSGICGDRAALAGAMCRSVGIPCKVVTGNMPLGFHAWISVYIEDVGWRSIDPGWERAITKEYEAITEY